MKLSSCSVLMSLCLLCVACEKPSCVAGTSDSVPAAIGQEPPTRAKVESAFASDGRPGLVAALGSPSRTSPLEDVWVFERRTTVSHVSCDPPETEIELVQAFYLVRAVVAESELSCVVEVRVFIGKELLGIDDMLARPRTPLGELPESCGVAVIDQGRLDLPTQDES